MLGAGLPISLGTAQGAVSKLYCSMCRAFSGWPKGVCWIAMGSLWDGCRAHVPRVAAGHLEGSHGAFAEWLRGMRLQDACGASMQVCRLAARHLQGSTSCGAFAGWLQGARSQDGYGAFGGQQWAVCRMAAGRAFAGRLWGIQRMTPQHMFIGWLHGADNWWAMHTHSQCAQLLYVDSKPSSIHNSHPLPYIGNVH